MIRWIIVLLGVSAGSSLTEINRSKPPTKNDTNESYVPQIASSSAGFKPKRQLDDDFEFDASTYDVSSVFPVKKINGLTSFDDEDTSDFSAVMSSPSFKVARSNSENLGIRNQNFDLSTKFDGKQQDNYSNENQPNSGLNSQAPSGYYKQILQQAKYDEKPNNIFSNDHMHVPLYSYPAMTEYTFSIPIYSLNQVSAQPIASIYQQNQATNQNFPYKTIFDQGLTNLQSNTKVYAPTHRYNPQQQQPFQAHFQNYAQNPYNVQYTTASSIQNNKKLLPIQLSSAQDITGYVKELEAAPVIFSAESGIQYQSEPAFTIPFDYTKTKNSNQRSGSNAPFLNQPTLGPIQVLPLQAATSTANFPKYKGASVAQYPQKPFSKIPNDYQEFKTQTQLHFGGNANTNANQNVQHKPVNAKPLERIRTDVEVIDKKKPIPPLPKNDDDDEANDDESGEGFQSKDSYLPKNDDDDVDSRKYFKESELEGDFKPSKSYPFTEYEEKYSKPVKKTSNDDDDDEENYDADVDLAAKFRYLSKSEDDDDDDENGSAEDKPRSKYQSYPIEDNYKISNDDDDDEEEGESRKLERKEKSFEFEREHPSSRRGKPRKERRKAVDEETEETIKKKQTKPKNSQHRSRGSNEFNNRPRSHANVQRHETPIKSSKKNHRRPYRDETGEPLIHASKTSRNFSPELHFKGPSSSDIPFTFSSTRTPTSSEDSYGLHEGSSDFLEDGGRSTFSKEEVAVTDSYGNPRKSTTSAPLPHPARSPKTAGDQRTNRQSSGVKTKPILVDSYNKPVSSGLRALVQSKPSYFGSDLSRDDILRRLKGI